MAEVLGALSFFYPRIIVFKSAPNCALCELRIAHVFVRRINAPVVKIFLLFGSDAVPKENASPHNTVAGGHYKLVVLEPWAAVDIQRILCAPRGSTVLLIDVVGIFHVFALIYTCGFYKRLVFAFSAVESLYFAKVPFSIDYMERNAFLPVGLITLLGEALNDNSVVVHCLFSFYLLVSMLMFLPSSMSYPLRA